MTKNVFSNQGTQGRAHAGSGSRGARLTTEMFSNAFSWLTPNVMQKGVRLRAADTRKTPQIPRAEGPFLSFQENSELGGSRLGSGTEFDLMPAEVTPEADMYALRTKEGEWVVFDPVKSMVLKTKDLTDRCLFNKRPEPISRVRPARYPPLVMPKRYRITVRDEKQQYQLRMEHTLINDYNKESSEVYFVKYGAAENTLLVSEVR